MRRKGDRNFGVWNPPTGMDAVRYSCNINLDLINKLNNLQLGKEKGFKQNFEIKSIQFKKLDTDLICYLNDNSLKIFRGMVHQGWGGHIN